MRVIVTGGRYFGDAGRKATEAQKRKAGYERLIVFNTLAALNRETPITDLVQGSGTGADFWAWTWANNAKEKHGANIRICSFAADWDLGRKAGPIRNQRMVDAGADLVLAFPGRDGTADCVRRARAAGIPVKEIEA